MHKKSGFFYWFLLIEAYQAINMLTSFEQNKSKELHFIMWLLSLSHQARALPHFGRIQISVSIYLLSVCFNSIAFFWSFRRAPKSRFVVNRLNVVRWFRRLSQESVCCEHEQIRIWNFNFRGGWSRRKKAKADRNEFALWAPGGKIKFWSQRSQFLFQIGRVDFSNEDRHGRRRRRRRNRHRRWHRRWLETVVMNFLNFFFQFEFFFFSVFVSNLERC